MECVGRGVFAHLDIADVCFTGVFRPSNSGALMVYFSDFGGVADKTEGCFSGSFLSINGGATMVYFPDFSNDEFDARSDADADAKADADTCSEIRFAGSFLSINGVVPMV